MNIDDFKAVRDKLEPEAGAAIDGEYQPLLISLAVSAKRIADAQERIAQQMESWTWQGTLATTPFSGGN